MYRDEETRRLRDVSLCMVLSVCAVKRRPSCSSGAEKDAKPAVAKASDKAPDSAEVGRSARINPENFVDLNKLNRLDQRRELRRRVYLPSLPLRLGHHKLEPHTGKALATWGYNTGARKFLRRDEL